MGKPDCFGLEFYDTEGSVCPHMDCLIRGECSTVYSASIGLIQNRRQRMLEEENKLKEIEDKEKK